MQQFWKYGSTSQPFVRWNRTLNYDAGYFQQGNIQRCRHYVDQLAEAKSALLHIVEERRPRAMDIISRNQSKRAVKKKERL